MSPLIPSALADWGVTKVLDGYRGAIVKETRTVRRTAQVVRYARRSSFIDECPDCGAGPHISPDDHTIAVCLRCGRDKWL